MAETKVAETKTAVVPDVDAKRAALVKDVEDKQAALVAAQAKLDAAKPELNKDSVIAVLVARAGGPVSISATDLATAKSTRIGVVEKDDGSVTLEAT